MSEVARVIAARALKRQADAAVREVCALWLANELAVGLGGTPPPGSEARFSAACDRAELLIAQWRAL